MVEVRGQNSLLSVHTKYLRPTNQLRRTDVNLLSLPQLGNARSSSIQIKQANYSI